MQCEHVNNNIKQCEHMNKKKIYIYIYIFFFLHMTYNAQPLLVVHFSYRAKLFNFGSTNVGIVLYLVILKIVI